ncbi:TIGR03016 family PEP-CTERM system-associated outer membrane protein [Roseomonas indoligenes]|uniref:TIGR03016 family PEP-CTERM system-associated outer membrane protein n=1 Tax=Roseomonas indoligenes TaxID=2820811 RepID=A0A940SA83_9PROT|nr:TIGR03016 family PEP-CTERM system-associated outer membrane protein [Pararoseomonas indoligenes]MBP0496093.1 TIGR03016 family PEP-CTERM system-associated outer membrane protein [Pararoseomonas indoligenes]
MRAEAAGPLPATRPVVLGTVIGMTLALASPARAEPSLSALDAPSLTTGAGVPEVGGDLAPSGDASGVPGPSGPFALPPTANTGLIRLDAPDFPYGALAPPPGEPGRGWNVTPSLGLQLLATDNLDLSRRNKRSDFVTSIIPGLLLSMDTARIRGIINYAPSIQFHTAEGERNRVDQRFNGQVLLTVVPDEVFLDIRGSGATQAASGGYAQQGNTVLGRDNRIQTNTVQISPYFVHRFGGLATVQVGYAFTAVQQDLGSNGFGGGANSGAFTPSGQRYFTDQDFTANEIYAIGRTGEDFGPLALESRLAATSYNGTGVLDGAYRRIASMQARYAITHSILALVEGGFEQQRYAGVPGIEISEPVWAFGGRVNFSPESWIMAKYGHRDGFNSATVDAVIALGGRTQLFANYAERLTTGAQRAVDLLSTTTLDEYGNPVDAATGAPSAQPLTDSLLGVQGSLFRIRRGAVSVSQSWPRDRISLTLSREERTPVSIQVGTAAFSQRGTSASLSWAHELTPATTAIGNFQYGRFTTPGAGKGDVLSASLTLATQLRRGLSAFAQYAVTSSRDDFVSGRALQNVVLVGLRQTF